MHHKWTFSRIHTIVNYLHSQAMTLCSHASHFLMTAWNQQQQVVSPQNTPSDCHMRMSTSAIVNMIQLKPLKSTCNLIPSDKQRCALEILISWHGWSYEYKCHDLFKLLMLWWQGCINFWHWSWEEDSICTHFMHTWRSDMHYTAIVADMWYEHFFCPNQVLKLGGTSPSQFPFTSAFRGTLFQF